VRSRPWTAEDGGRPWAADSRGRRTGSFLLCFPKVFAPFSQKCCSSPWNSIDFEIAAVDSRGPAVGGGRPWAADGRGRAHGRGRRTALDGGQPWTAHGPGRPTALDGGRPWPADGRGRRTAVGGGRPWTRRQGLGSKLCRRQSLLVERLITCSVCLFHQTPSIHPSRLFNCD